MVKAREDRTWVKREAEKTQGKLEEADPSLLNARGCGFRKELKVTLQFLIS